MACLGLVYGLFKVGLPYLFTVGLGLVCCYFFFRLVFSLLGGSVGVLRLWLQQFMLAALKQHQINFKPTLNKSYSNLVNHKPTTNTP